jgi:RNA polymerase sigma-70 factor, ECF subfamily
VSVDLTSDAVPLPKPESDLPLLMTRYQQGEAAAIEELVQRLSPALIRFFVRTSGSSEAEDLLQDCWIRIHKSRHTYRATEPVMPWIFAIARHTGLDGFRKRRRIASREILVSEPPDSAAESAERPKENTDRFTQMVADLPESQREVLIMLKVSGMSLEDVARATSSTVGSVKQKAHRAYERLRQTLKREGV